MLRPPVPSYDSELSIPIGQARAEPDEKQIPCDFFGGVEGME